MNFFSLTPIVLTLVILFWCKIRVQVFLKEYEQSGREPTSLANNYAGLTIVVSTMMISTVWITYLLFSLFN